MSGMRHVKDRVSFFERHLKSESTNGNSGQDEEDGDDCKSKASSPLSASFVESRESVHSTHSNHRVPSRRERAQLSSTFVTGKKVFYCENEEKRNLASRGTSDIWSMFPGGHMSLASNPLSKGHASTVNGRQHHQTAVQNLANSNNTGLFSRYSQEANFRGRGESNTTAVSSSVAGRSQGNSVIQPPPAQHTAASGGGVPAKQLLDHLPLHPGANSSRKLDSVVIERFNRQGLSSGNGGQKRSWGVANNNRAGFSSVVTATAENLSSTPVARGARTTMDHDTTEPCLKRLNRDQKSALELAMIANHAPIMEDRTLPNTLPRPPAEKGTDAAKLSYAKRMHAGYLRSTGLGSFVPKPPSKWGQSEGDG